MVTINVGGGPGGSPTRRMGMGDWARHALETKQPAIVFAQEVPSEDWLRIWSDADYKVTDGEDRGWSIRSALITRKDLDVQPLTKEEFPSLWYHGSYVAAALWTNAPDTPLVLASVHASPNPAELETYEWPLGAVPAPTARSGGPDSRWTPYQLWDSDMVLTTLLAMHSSGSPVIAGGDFNESRLYDTGPGGERFHGWGHEFFDAMKRGGLIELSLDSDDVEIPTRGGLQLDHVLVSETLDTAAGLLPETVVDEWWSQKDPDTLSDHAALWVPLPIPMA